MHMLGGRTWYGTWASPQPLTHNEITNGTITIHNHFLSKGGEDGVMPNIPSFVIVNQDDNGMLDFMRFLVSKGPTAREDWGRELFYLRKFGSDAFGRAGAEIRAGFERAKAEAAIEGRDLSEYIKAVEWRYGHIPSFTDFQPPTFEASPLTEAPFEEWWAKVNDAEFRISSLIKFAEMWVGAISIIRDSSIAKDRRTVEFEQIRRFLSDFGHAVVARDVHHGSDRAPLRHSQVSRRAAHQSVRARFVVVGECVP
jgi:hypothetical protein